ncbi:DNA polymerase [Caballeronia terrestris]|uniref:DNA polymerase n=1 Tax=Caballeronia terrestris TaxID=1226301 RepID=A0A158HZK0_9BURK|nr:DNA polymerase [Caballeronia terrestris]
MPGAKAASAPSIGDERQPCFALADHARILLPDIVAFRLGVRPGSTRSHAFALAPQLTLLVEDNRLETQALEAVALALLAFTPKVVLAHANTVLLEVSGSVRLFGGLKALFSKVTATVKDSGFTSRMGCAPTAWGAWLLAHARTRRVIRRTRIVKSTTLPRILDVLPVSLLPSAATHANLFKQIGCNTLADLRRLPRSGVTRRFGAGVLQLLAQAYGEAPDPRAAFCAPASFEARLELQARVESAEALLFAARRLVLQLAGWLSAHHAAVSEFTLLLEHELAARSAPKTSTMKVAWAVPTRDADHVLWLLREKLNQTALAAPVIEIKLFADKVSEHAPPPDTLFPMPNSDSESMAQLLERLSARLGAENVLQLVARDDHRPEAAMGVEVYQPAVKGKVKAKATRKKAPVQARGAAAAEPLVEEDQEDLGQNDGQKSGQSLQENLGFGLNLGPNLEQNIEGRLGQNSGESLSQKAPRLDQNSGENSGESLSQTPERKSRQNPVESLSGKSLEQNSGPTSQENLERNPDLSSRKNLAKDREQKHRQTVGQGSRPNLRSILVPNLEQNSGGNIEGSIGENSTPIDQSLGQSLDQSLDQSLGQSLGQSLDQSLGQSCGESSGGSLGRSHRQTSGKSAVQALGQNFGESLGKGFGQNFDPAPGQHLGKSVEQDLGQILRLNLWSKLGLIIENNTRPKLGQKPAESFGHNLDPGCRGPDFGHKLGQSYRESLEKSLGQNSVKSLGQSIEQNFGQSSGESFEWNLGQSIGQNFGSISGESTNQSTNQSTNPTLAQNPQIQPHPTPDATPDQLPLNLPDRAVPSQPRPCWILETPLKLLLRNERPFYRRPLKIISRTERIEAGWWDGNGVQRDYYIASDDRGRMFWLYRERLSGEWFLHGFFG